MARGVRDEHHPNRQVGRDRFAAPNPAARRSGPVTHYNQNTEWASDPVDPSWGPPTGPAANWQQLPGGSDIMSHTVNGSPHAPKAVQKGAKEAGGLMDVTTEKAIPLGRDSFLVPGRDKAGNYIAKPHSMSPRYADETGADAFNAHIAGSPGTYPKGRVRYDADGNIHSGRNY